MPTTQDEDASIKIKLNDQMGRTDEKYKLRLSYNFYS